MTKLTYKFKPLYLMAGDGWPFWMQADGSLCDAPNPEDGDLAWDNLDQINEEMDNEPLIKGTISDHVRYAELRSDQGGPFPWPYSDQKDLAADLELITWYRGKPSPVKLQGLTGAFDI